MNKLIILVLSLTGFSAIAFERVPATGVDRNQFLNISSTSVDISHTAGQVTAQGLDCPACRAWEAKNRGSLGRSPASVYDALNPSLSVAAKGAFVPGQTPLNPEPKPTDSNAVGVEK